MSQVFVVDTNKQPCLPIHPGQARLLLKKRQAAVWRYAPFTIILKTAVPAPPPEALRLKIDPGSRITGLALQSDRSGEVVWAAELTHRGQTIKTRLDARRAVRRSRRQRKTRYRQPRFANRRKAAGRLPPSLLSRVANVLTWVNRLRRLCPMAALSLELVKFDFQRMDHPEISGIEYQQGTLCGYELREYLLEKWHRQCAYCGARDVPLQIEHIQPRTNGGTDRVSNLALACEPCNSKKGTQDIRQFLAGDQQRLAQILAQAKAPLKDAAAVNSTRWALYEQLKALSLPVECDSGGRTKYNRIRRGLPKTHWLDAACVGGVTPDPLTIIGVVPLRITATGSGCRQVCRMNRYGFPRTSAKRGKHVYGFQTGDLVRAVVPGGKRAGVYVGRVAVRASGSFNITAAYRTVQGISYRFCTLVQRKDGYTYQKAEAAFPLAP